MCLFYKFVKKNERNNSFIILLAYVKQNTRPNIMAQAKEVVGKQKAKCGACNKTYATTDLCCTSHCFEHVVCLRCVDKLRGCPVCTRRVKCRK